MNFYIADAFTEELFGGNPAGVVILGNNEDFPSSDVMRKTAAELRYSETAFIKQLSKNEFNIRYFTPAQEVDLCGHATIASFLCLKDAGLVLSGNTYHNKTLAGDLKINVNPSGVMMEMATPKRIAQINEDSALKELYEIMGAKANPVTAVLSDSNRIPLFPEIISTGLPDIIMPLTSRDDLATLNPDFKRLTALSQKYSVTGVHAFTLEKNPGSSETAYCRNFAPLYDIDEEAATGTANGALTYYLYSRGLIADGATSLFVQGQAMNRPSKIHSYVKASPYGSAEIRIGGNAIILAKGRIYIG